jgi:hypothetical protein
MAPPLGLGALMDGAAALSCDALMMMIMIMMTMMVLMMNP